MRDALRGFVWRVAPNVMADRAVRWNAAIEQRSPHWVELGRVEAGPFAGLVYPPEVRRWVGAPALKQTGEYERPLAELLRGLLERAAVFVDVGASDGYYLIGAARTGVEAIGYESSRVQRRNLRLTANANGVEVEVRGHCRRLPDLPPGAVLLVDAEGAEDRLVQAAPVEAATVLVELHERVIPGVTDRIRSRLDRSHTCRLIEGADESGRMEPPVWGVFVPR